MNIQNNDTTPCTCSFHGDKIVTDHIEALNMNFKTEPVKAESIKTEGSMAIKHELAPLFNKAIETKARLALPPTPATK
jgi:hypothetical protein